MKNKPNKKTRTLIIILLIIAAVLLIWGLIGGQKAKEIGVTCDIGLGENNVLCWKWHTNFIGQAQETIKDFFDGRNP